MYTVNSLLILCGLVAIIIFWFESLRIREQIVENFLYLPFELLKYIPKSCITSWSAQ